MLAAQPPGFWLAALAVLALVFALGWRLGSRRRRGDDAAAPPPSASRAAAPEPDRLDEPSGTLDHAAASGAEPVLRPAHATLGRYRIERALGHGAMGIVYLAHDPQQGGRAVAIKTMALAREFEGVELAEARARFFREAEVARRLQHADIVSVFDAGEDRGLAFIAMEHVCGHDLLRHTLPGQLLAVPVVLRTLARVAQALAYAHTQGVVHRDVKPANVMIDPASGVVKVADFGIARVTDACRTRTGLVQGTPSFMSPEQMAGGRVDGRTDLYALGVMLFQLLSGALPHQADSMARLMSSIVNDTAPDVRTLRPDLPDALARIVARALEKRPEARYADGARMAADLLAVAGPPGSGSPAAGEGFAPADPRHNAGH